MPELNQPPDLDEALRRILSEPSTAARIALAAADALDEHPHLTMTPFDRGYAAEAGKQHATKGMPAVVANEAATAAFLAMPTPHPAETCGEYAVRLRDVAREL